jgi:hypothetical protein
VNEVYKYYFYKAHQEEKIKEHLGDFVAIKGKKVLGVLPEYDSSLSGYGGTWSKSGNLCRTAMPPGRRARYVRYRHRLPCGSRVDTLAISNDNGKAV